MADAITALIGAIIMIGYMMLLVAKLAAPPFTLVCLIGLALMLWAFWQDDWRPIIIRPKK